MILTNVSQEAFFFNFISVSLWVLVYRSFFSTLIEGSGSGIKKLQFRLLVSVAGAVLSRDLR
jgi:hypothetical protein